MTEDDVRSVFMQHDIVLPKDPTNLVQAMRACAAQSSNELRNALEACVELMSTLPTLNGAYGLAVLEHARGLLELLPITDDVTEGMAKAGAEVLNNASPFQKVEEVAHEAYAAMRAAALRRPVDMLLWCPACGAQHIDQPDPADPYPTPEKDAARWLNPPHRSHLCGACGWQWRPSDTPTNGVAALQTAGAADRPPDPTRAAYIRAYMRRPGYFALPPTQPGDLWAVGCGSTKATNCYYGPTLEAAIEAARKFQA
jgi:hypothetical protein